MPIARGHSRLCRNSVDLRGSASGRRRRMADATRPRRPLAQHDMYLAFACGAALLARYRARAEIAGRCIRSEYTSATDATGPARGQTIRRSLRPSFGTAPAGRRSRHMPQRSSFLGGLLLVGSIAVALARTRRTRQSTFRLVAPNAWALKHLCRATGEMLRSGPTPTHVVIDVTGIVRLGASSVALLANAASMWGEAGAQVTIESCDAIATDLSGWSISNTHPKASVN